MTTYKKHINTISLAVIFVFAIATSLGAAEEPLKVAPENSLFYMQVNNLDYSLSQVDQFLAGLLPVPMGIQMTVRMQLAQMLGSPALDGVKTTGKFAVFAAVGENGQFDDNAISILLPIIDYHLFVSSNVNLTEPDANGICQIKGAAGGVVTQIDSFAMIKSPESYNELLAFKKSAAGRKSLSEVLTAEQISEADKAPLWLYVDIQQVNKIFGAQIAAGIEEAKRQIQNMPKEILGSGDPARFFNFYAVAIKAFLEQTKSVAVAVNPKPDVLVLSSTVSALPDTEIARFLTSDSAAKTDNKLLGYLQDGAMLNGSGNITGKLNAYFTPFFIKAFGGTLSSEDQAAIDSYIANLKTVYTGYDAMSLAIDPNDKPPFSGVYVAQVAGKDKFRSLLEESQKLMQTAFFRDFYKSMGMDVGFTINYDTDNYKGVSIDSMKLSMKTTDPNSPQAQLINSFYGDGIDYRLAYIDGLGIYSIGGGMDTNMKKLIDTVTAGGPGSLCSEMKAALALLPDAERKDFVATFNIIRALKIVPAMMPIPMMPKMDSPTKSNIVVAGSLGDGKVRIDTAVPKQHLMEIMQVFQTTRSKVEVPETEPNDN